MGDNWSLCLIGKFIQIVKLTPLAGGMRQKGVDEEIVKAILSHGEDPALRTTKLESVCVLAMN